MKIQCTKDEKDFLITVLDNNDHCPFTEGLCYYDSIHKSCVPCLEQRIEWEVTEG